MNDLHHLKKYTKPFEISFDRALTINIAERTCKHILDSPKIDMEEGNPQKLPSPGGRGLRGGHKKSDHTPSPHAYRQAGLSPAFAEAPALRRASGGGASRRQASRERRNWIKSIPFFR